MSDNITHIKDKDLFKKFEVIQDQIKAIAMKQFTITIPDNKKDIFVDMMKSINYVKKIEESTPVDIPGEHMQIVRERIKKYENSPESYLNWEDIEKKIKLD